MNAEIPERTVMKKLRVMEPMITHVTVANIETLHPAAVKAGFARVFPAKLDFTKIT
jgi:DNA repair photolyase